MTDEAHFEYTDADASRDEFRLAFWTAIGQRSCQDDVYPTTVENPDDIDWGEVDADDFRVADDDAARRMADTAHAAITNCAADGLSMAVRNTISRGSDDGQAAVIVMPEWFASDELGAFESVWLGRFKGGTRKGGAWKVESLVPWTDRGEDSYFLDVREFATLPKSLTTVFTGARESKTTGAVVERGLDSSQYRVADEDADPRDADLAVTGVKRTEYGPKLVADFPAPWEDETQHEAIKEAFQALDWDTCHATFDGDDWVFDVGAIGVAIEYLTQQGISVGVAQAAIDAVEGHATPQAQDELAAFLSGDTDRITTALDGRGS